MADIDPAADIEIHRGFAQITVRIPLAGHVSQEWLTHYKSLASKRNARPVEAEDVPDRSWIVVAFRPLPTARQSKQCSMLPVN